MDPNNITRTESQLPRHLSLMSVVGMSFAIMAVPFGLSTTLYITLINGQAVTMLWGWVLVTLVSLSIAASLAEICAVYPTAGGVYYWSALLSTPKYASLVSFIDGWVGLVGNLTVTLSINFSGAQLILSAITIFREDYEPNEWQTILCFWAVMIVTALVNVFGTMYLDRLNKVCIWWTAASVIIIITTLLATSPSKRSAEFVFTHYDTSASGWPPAWSFFIGLLQPTYVITAYGMVASMCDEVQQPEREVPKAMVLSVLIGGITGLVYIIPLLFVLPDVATLLQSSQPIGMIFTMVTGSKAGGFCLLILILGILFFAGVGALTATSRNVWAFSRDAGLPGYEIWSKVSEKYSCPLWALGLSTVVDCLLGCIYFGSSAAFNSFTGVAAMCLSASYCVPILVLLIRGRKLMESSIFPLGKFGYVLNYISVIWILLAMVIFSMPVSLPITLSSMNYASVVFAGFASISAVWYFAHGRKNFKGPLMTVDGVDHLSGHAESEGNPLPIKEKAENQGMSV